MKINRIELYRVKLPLSHRRPGFFSVHSSFSPSWIPGFRQSEVRFYLLKLCSDTGHEGFSAMPCMGTERDGMGSLLGNYLLGMNPLDTALMNQRIQEMAYIGMRNGWIEIAFWDLIGKIQGKPIWELWGGEGGLVHPYASTGATHGHDPAYATEIVKRHQDAGFRGIKLRVKSSELAPMVEYVAAAREAAGPDLAIMVDANQGWPVDIIDETPKWNLRFALELAKAVEPYGLSWLEEPLNKGNLEGLAELRRSTGVPIAGGELNSSWLDFKSMLALGCLDVYQPDPVLAGGTYAGGMSVIAWLVSRIAEHNRLGQGPHLKFSPHTWTTGLGFYAGLHLYGLVPQRERFLLEFPLEGHWNSQHWARFIKGGVRRDSDGSIRIPDGPGLGIEVDMSVIRKFGRRVAVCTKGSTARHAVLDRGLKAALELKARKEEQMARSAEAPFQIPRPPF